MPRLYPKYIREEAVKRYLAGKKATDVAAEIGCSVSSLYRWVYKNWKERSDHNAADGS